MTSRKRLTKYCRSRWLGFKMTSNFYCNRERNKTSLSDRLRHQSFHFMRFAGHGDRLNDSKAKHKIRNELLCRRSQRAGWVLRQLLRRRAWLERVSKPRLDTFSTTLWHISSQTHQSLCSRHAVVRSSSVYGFVFVSAFR